jgi:hypothetical protein
MMARVAAGVDSDAENNEDDYSDDFQQTEPIFQLNPKSTPVIMDVSDQTYLAIKSHRYNICCNQYEPED